MTLHTPYPTRLEPSAQLPLPLWRRAAAQVAFVMIGDKLASTAAGGPCLPSQNGINRSRPTCFRCARAVAAVVIGVMLVTTVHPVSAQVTTPYIGDEDHYEPEEVEEQELGDRLNDAMSQYASSPTLAAFTCQISGSELLGIPDITGRDHTSRVSIDVGADGTGMFNGTPVAPVRVAPNPQRPTEMLVAFYNVADVQSAANGVEGSAAPLANMSPEEMESYQAFTGLGRKMTERAMGGRQRFLVVTLENDSVFIFDLSASNEAVNARAPQCVRER